MPTGNREKLLFVNPDARVNKDVPNLALGYAAAHFKGRVIDLNTLVEPKDRFLDVEAATLGISVQSRTYGESRRIAALYNAKFPEARVNSVSGFIDVQCCYPFIEMEDSLRFDEPFSDNYPFPDYELFDSFPIFLEKWRTGVWDYPIMTSLGCPYQCVFCMSRNRLWRKRSARNSFLELERAKKRWGIKSFVVMDDCFNLDKERVIEFAGLVKDLDLRWSCNNGIRADRFDEDIARAMSGSGCINVGFGIESSDPEILKRIKKGETIGRIEDSIRIAKKYFRRVNGFFIIGLPGSSYEKDAASLSWALERGINAHFSCYVPFEGTKSYDELFWGGGRKPASNEYPKDLQEKLYSMTEYMRGEIKRTDIFKRVYMPLKAAWLFDRKNAAGCAFSLFKKLTHRLKRNI